MRIGLIGNMNNNGSVLLRYLRDIGHEPTLFQFWDDGRGSLSLFSLENDTWEGESLRHCVKRLPFENGPVSSGSSVAADLELARAYLKSLARPGRGIPKKPKREDLMRLFGGFDLLLGCGIAPAMLRIADLSLDVYYPYSIGIEFVNWDYYVHPLYQGLLRYPVGRSSVRAKQVSGILAARNVYSYEEGPTQSTLAAIGAKAIPLPLPAFYNREVLPKSFHSPIDGLVKRLETHRGLKFIHHSRHLWKRPHSISEVAWKSISKNNHWAIQAFAESLELRGDSLLVAVKYGPDWRNSVELVEKLGIEQSVIWIEPLPRKLIVELIRCCDVGLGQFYEQSASLWGGAGWEVLGSGRYLINNLGAEDIFARNNAPTPPIGVANSPEQLKLRVVEAVSDPEMVERKGRDSLAWFDEHQGENLVRKWISLAHSSERKDF